MPITAPQGATHEPYPRSGSFQVKQKFEMTKKFVIHIGPAKTGTSSLQEVLFQKRDLLLANGYDYPAFGRHVDMQQLPGHHGIPDRLRRLEEVPPGVIDNLNQLPDDRTFIFSSENFSHLSRPAVRELVQGLGSDDLEVIYYARRWDHLLPSVWQELIKHGDSRPYLEFLNAQIAAPMASAYLNYMNAIDPWASILGPKKIRIFSYDTARAEGYDVVSHFCKKVLGVEMDLAEPRRDNVRQPTEETEILRMLNRLAFGQRGGSPMVRFALGQKRQDLQDEIKALTDILRPYIRNAPLCPPFLFEHVERAFLKRYGHRVENLTGEGLLLDERTFETVPYVCSDYLLKPDVVDLLRKILKALNLN